MRGLTAIMLCLLAVAAWRDLAARIIPDWVSAALAVLGLALRMVEGPWQVASSFAAALLLFLCLLFLHGRGALGGGDVKLLTALVLGLSPLDGYYMVQATVLAGGVLGLSYLLLRRLLPPVAPSGRGHGLLSRVARIEAWRIRHGGPLPYGVAIAFGACIVLLRTES